jgi:uncharacterized protein (TIGR02391 family)
MAVFTQTQVESIASALGDTAIGLSGSEIAHLLNTLKMADPDPSAAKRHRLLAAFATDQNRRKDRTAILEFIRRAMAPARWLNKREGYEPLRSRLNESLAFMGLEVDAAGQLAKVDAAATISEAEKRARHLRADLVRRNVHPDVLAFCRPEWVSENYFHAVLEAVKSVGDKLRGRTGLTDDGATLINRALGGDSPMLAINPRLTKSEQDEQKGFCNLVIGTFGMFRNPTAHEAKLRWEMSLEDAEDLLSLVSLIHRRLDRAVMPLRA